MRIEKRIFLTVVAAASLAVAGVYPVIETDWFAQTFLGLADGTAFTGQGATGGYWETLPTGVATVLRANGRKGVCVDLSSTTNVLRFVATGAVGQSVRRIDFAIAGEPTPWLPAVHEGDQFALSLASSGNGIMTFVGWTADGWVKLSCQGLVQRRNEWIDCRVELEYPSVGATAYVTYYACCGGRGYQPLTDGKGRSRFKMADSATVRSLAFDGTGLIGDFKGVGVEQDTTRAHEWTGPTGEDIRWENPENWSGSKVPRDGDVAQVPAGKRITYGKYTITAWAASEFSIVSNQCLSIGSGDIEITCDDGDYTSLGTVYAESGVSFRASGKYYSIEMSGGSQLVLAAGLEICGKAFFLDGVKLDILDATEDERLISAPYGSGGEPASLTLNGAVKSGWAVEWHGRLDGSTALWLINRNSTAAVAIWKDGAWGNLVYEQNWNRAPRSTVAALIGNGQAHVNAGDTFEFTRWFDVGHAGTGEVDMSGGSVLGNADAAVLIGSSGGTGLLDVVGGAVRAYDYLWNYALTLGVGTNSTGSVRVRGGKIDAVGGSVSVGAEGAADLEISGGSVSADALGVGHSGSLTLSDGVLSISNSIYIGRSTRDEAYDVKMTVSAGTVSNLASGAVWIGSYGGLGSKAVLELSGGEIQVTNRFVCGGFRSGEVDVNGGTLVAPEIRIGHDLIDEEDVASFNLLDGCVETAGFTSGTNGVRTISLSGGEIVATTTNDDFFAGIEVVRLEGDTVISNACDIATRAALMGSGGFVKAGGGTNRVDGYAAWAGKTVVTDGVLDMAGGMVMGELSVAEGAAVIRAKYDDVDLYKFTVVREWEGTSPSSSPYLRVGFTMTADVGHFASITNDEELTKGAISCVSTEYDGLSLLGWTALGWTRLDFPDHASISKGDAYDLRILFDFSGGKQYVIYYVKRDGEWVRLVSEDGLTVFPVAGKLANASGFSGVGVSVKEGGFLGEELDVDASSQFVWSNPNGGIWNDKNNWTGGQGAEYPKIDDIAAVHMPVRIDVATKSAVSSLVVNANMTLTNGTLSIAGSVVGVGTLNLAGVALDGVTPSAAIRIPVTVVGKEGNALGVDENCILIAGALRGSGDLSAKAQFYGDTHAFSGRIDLLDGGIFSASAANNASSAWVISGYPFAVGNLAYEFGSLSGSFAADPEYDAKGVTLVVGARNEDCSLQGAWAAGYASGLEWTAETATMTYSVAHSSFVRLSGGGRVFLSKTDDADVIPEEISFVDKGGELALGDSVATDVSGILVKSTAPIAFNDGGVDRIWASKIDASNSGGFVKRGKGTLTLLQCPAYTGETVVEEGTLVVPFGTRLSSVRIERNAHLVVDMGGVSESGVAFAVARANRELKAPYFSVTNSTVSYSTEAGENNGIVLYVGSQTFVWTGSEDTVWQNTNNWTVGGLLAVRLPEKQDTVCFTSDSVVDLVDGVSVRRMDCSGDLLIVGHTNTMETVGAISMPSGRLTLMDEVSVDVAEISVRALSGTGAVIVAKGDGSLTVAPENGISDVFVGELDVANFTKRGAGTFTLNPRDAFAGAFSIDEGVLLWNCQNDVTNHPSADISMKAGAMLDLCGTNVLVRSFTGAGTVTNGFLVTTSGVITQQGGDLTIPATLRTTYVLSRAGEHLQILDAAGMEVSIVVPKSWYVAGVSGRRAVMCADRDVAWKPDPERAKVFKAIDEGDDWWSIAGGGFAIRLR